MSMSRLPSLIFISVWFVLSTTPAAYSQEVVADCGTLRSVGDCHYFDGFDIGTYNLETFSEGCQLPDTIYVWGLTDGQSDCPEGIATLGTYYLGNCAEADWGCGVITDCGQAGCRCVEMDGGLVLDLTDFGGFGIGDRIHVVGHEAYCWLTWCPPEERVIPTLLEVCDGPIPTKTISWGRIKSFYR